MLLTPSSGIPLPISLPPNSEWLVRLLEHGSSRLQLYQLAQILKALPNTPQPHSGSQSQAAPPAASAHRPFDGFGQATTVPSDGKDPLSALARNLAPMMGNSQLTPLPLPSLAQLANPTLLAMLLTQIGQFPANSRLAPPLGPIAQLWQRLLMQRRSRTEDDSTSDEHSLLASEAQLNTLTPMIRQLTDFQQQSQADSEHPLLFLALPYGQQQEQRELQLSLQRYQSEPQAQQRSWLLTLRFELDPGPLLVKARYSEGTLRLDMTANSSGLCQQAERYVDALTERLESAGLRLSSVNCQVGTVPDKLTQGRPMLIYGR
ncbi:hypothetical protein GCM10023333_07840 [Ferrimonas pelagia]|uniref:Flagellar hook-length control protein FliK n=2 Tax=Ferrimonas pelagia TaxID=1177826 RepID=A0ABP9EFJ7_9GAMM